MSENPTLKKIGIFLRERPTFEKILDYCLRPVEIITKKPLFGCHMCGQCVLHSTGMVCPMNCPKRIRNGPCGGVRGDGSCEVYPDRECVWLRAYENSKKLPWTHEIHDIRPPVNWLLEGSSSWVNFLSERDQVVSGCSQGYSSALLIIEKK